ncbi:MAG: BGTF surface domain-containing protein [Halanaeroarchaeum sp.]
MSHQRHAIGRLLVIVSAVVLSSVATATVGLAATEYPSASFTQSTYTITRGESVDITFSHSAAARLEVGGDDLGYELHVAVGGSGSSTVTLHTYGSTSPNPGEYVEGGTPTLVEPASGGLQRSLAPGEYPLRVVIDNVTRAVATLVIEPRSPATVTAMVAPGDLDAGDRDVGAIYNLATPRKTVARGDLAVFAIDVTGLTRGIGPDHLAGGPQADGVVVHFEDLSPLPNRPKHSFDATSSSAVDAFLDEKEQRLLVTWDTSGVAYRSDGHRYEVSVSLQAEYNPLVRENVTESNVTVTVVKPSVDLALPDRVVIAPWEDRTLGINGTTNLAPNSIVDVRVRGSEPRPFLRYVQPTVTANGTFEASLDLSGLPGGHTYPLYVLGYEPETTRDVVLLGDDASFAFPNQTAENGSAVTLRNVTLGAGGYLVVGRWSNDSSTVVGVSDRLVPGGQGNVTVPLDPALNESAYLTARAYVDRNGNGTFDPANDTVYTTNGSAVNRTAVVWLGSARSNATTPPTTHTNEMGAPTTIPVSESPPLTPVKTTTETPVPLWIPVLAMIVAALLGRRRV